MLSVMQGELSKGKDLLYKYLKYSSKKQYIWEFQINGEPQKIELFDSKLSGKKKVLKNGIVECELVCDESFFRNFSLNGHNCTIIQCGEKNELRIDNQTFEHLYNLERNKQFFSSNPEPTSSFFTAKSNKIEKNKPGITKNNFYQQQQNNNQPSLFNFNIKPASEATSHETKKFQFKINEVHNVGYKVQPLTNTATTNNNQQRGTGTNLLDFDVGSQSQPIQQTQPMNNPIENPPVASSSNDLFDVFGTSSNTNSTVPQMNVNVNPMQNSNNVLGGDFNGINFNMNVQQSTTPNMYNQIDLTSNVSPAQNQFNTMPMYNNVNNVPMNNQNNSQINNQY